MEASTEKLLYMLSASGLKPSNFINIYKKNSFDIDKTVRDITCKIMQASDESVIKNKRNGVSWNFKELLDYITSNKINVFNISEPAYPVLLKEITYPPPVLFVKGKKIRPDGLFIAVVGTRKYTCYGRDAASYISEQLSRIGITVVSGAATGIDYFAHKAALREKGGSIGVLGCGIDVVYPYENKALYKEMIDNGSLITEYLPKTQPLRQNFPARNRIISGMSMGVVVVEAGEKSGALITSDFALEQNREVFAIPGSIFNYESRGCHGLIKKGAKLVENIDDILDEIKQFTADSEILKTGGVDDENRSMNENGEKRQYLQEVSKKLTAGQKKVYDCIGCRPVALEEIVIQTGLGISRVLQVISELQFADLIIEKNLNEFVRI